MHIRTIGRFGNWGIWDGAGLSDAFEGTVALDFPRKIFLKAARAAFARSSETSKFTTPEAF